jgi:hypothetical protein
MESRKANHDQQGDPLSKYEGGVWIFLLVVAVAILGLIFWLGYMVFLQG